MLIFGYTRVGDILNNVNKSLLTWMMKMNQGKCSGAAAREDGGECEEHICREYSNYLSHNVTSPADKQQCHTNQTVYTHTASLDQHR